ncbi:MAG: efflux RND transporter periplasmic adaptor subunit [Candidatus Schekmanbacteria bacterium]|nr:MAG: efflux RND transporter periplasmic adaptor subunit [Candidatus Schekmanbacteria bacterium]
MSRQTKIKKILIPFIIIALGFVVRWALVQSKPAPNKKIEKNTGPLVNFLTVEKKDYQITVSGTGEVTPKQEANITPQVSGRIVYLSPHFLKGGFFRKGEVFFKIEPIDYELALAQAKANLQRLKNEYNRSKALFEKGMINENAYEKALDDYKVAEARFKQAKLDLQRTVVKAPFNCLIRTEDIDIGEYVRAGNSVGTIAGTDSVEIIVPLPQKDLYWIDIPQMKSKKEGAEAEVILETPDNNFVWKGKVVRILGEINRLDRMPRVVVEVSDPYQLKKRREDKAPNLAIGSFVKVHIKGKLFPSICAIPRKLLLNDSTVWLIDNSNRLRKQKITVLHREEDVLLIKDGLDSGDRLLLTNIPGAADGLVVSPVNGGVAE